MKKDGALPSLWLMEGLAVGSCSFFLSSLSSPFSYFSAFPYLILGGQSMGLHW